MIVNRIYEWARIQPTRNAMMCNDVFVDYAFFARSIASMRRTFSNWDLPVGKTAIVLVPSRAYAWVVVLALRSLGLTTIVTESLERARSLGLRDVACVVFAKSSASPSSADRRNFPGAKFIELPSAITNDDRAGELPSPDDGRTPFGDHIIYTSGTTGAYKKIRKPGKYVMEYARLRADFHKMDNTSSHYIFDYPLWTSLGFGYPLACWVVGACVMFAQGKPMRDKIFQYEFTHCTTTPTFLRELCDLVQSSGGFRENLSLSIGGGFLPFADAKRAADTLTNDIWILYGSSELGKGTMYSRFFSRDDLDALTPVEGRVLEVVDDHDAQVPVGQEGELRILLEEIDAKGYLDDEDATTKWFRKGYFYPGDMAIRLADGRIRLAGRTADVLNVKGWKIAASPMEHALQDFLGVDEVCVLSGLNDEGVEELVIVLQCDALPDQAKIAAASQRMPPFVSHRFTSVAKFPRTASGMSKVNRAALRQMIMQKNGRAEPYAPSGAA